MYNVKLMKKGEKFHLFTHFGFMQNAIARQFKQA